MWEVKRELFWILSRIKRSTENSYCCYICVCIYVFVCVYVCMFVLYSWSRGKWNKPIINIPIKQVVFTNLTGALVVSTYVETIHLLFTSSTSDLICLLEFSVWSGSLAKQSLFCVFSRQRKKVILKHSKMNLKLSSQESDFILNHQVFNLWQFRIMFPILVWDL